MTDSVDHHGKTTRTLLGIATPGDLETIYRLRHEVYASELGQHQPHSSGRLTDALDGKNIFLVAKIDDDIVGFISITPPSAHRYSIDKYFTRDELPFEVDERTFEIRLLTVLHHHRGRELATLLMYAAFRHIESHGGTKVVAIGKREVVDMYRRCGMKPLGLSTRAGEVIYDLMESSIESLRSRMTKFSSLIDRLETHTDWQLNFPFRKPASCFHGGAFFETIGVHFDSLDCREKIINADVLDAWFPPSPKVIEALEQHLPWLLRTSPPTGCEGLVDTIADTRGVAAENILPGAGSSDLIFRAFRHWLTPQSRILILDPTYGEYAHVMEHVIGGTVDRLPLCGPPSQYDIDLDLLREALKIEYDVVVLVNPNSPTGRYTPKDKLEPILQQASSRTRVWVDETYIEYVGSEQSLETFAAGSENIIVCKSMSKVYALSGIRVAYLCAGPHQLEELRTITPPWVVGLPGQVAGVNAIKDPLYYDKKYNETARLREQLREELKKLEWEVIPGVANFALCHLPLSGPDAATIVKKCRAKNLFLRDASAMGSQLGSHALRIAVKDAATNERMIEILSSVIHD